MCLSNPQMVWPKSMVDLKNGHNFHVLTFVKWFCSSSHPETKAVFPDFEDPWLWDLFWPIDYRENDGVFILSLLGLKRSFLVLLTVLRPLFWHVNESRLACWRMRNHVEQRLATPAEVLLDPPASKWPSSY